MTSLQAAAGPPQGASAPTILRQLRLARGLTQLEVARRARMAPGDLSRIETGKTIPYRGQLRRLARVLGVRLAELAPLLDERVTVARRP